MWCSPLIVALSVVVAVQGSYVPHSAGLSDALLLREMVARMGNGLADPGTGYLPLEQGEDSPSRLLPPSYYGGGPDSDELELQSVMGLGAARDLRDMELSVPRDLRDSLELSLGREEEPEPYGGDMAMHPALRDGEYLSHGHLLGNMLAQFPPGSSYGTMRIKPSGAGEPSATSERKTDGALPAYCNPPNPCPLGYTEGEGCEEEFENTAAFSRNYQGQQACMCDTEHMFDCPDTSRESEIRALARSIQNEGLMDSTLDKIMDEMRQNPYLQGDKLPIAAKKGVMLP